MNRVKTFCGCCEQEVELYSDHLCVGGASHRCGNCFEPFFAEDLERAKVLHDELRSHDAQRAKIIDSHRRA